MERSQAHAQGARQRPRAKEYTPVKASGVTKVLSCSSLEKFSVCALDQHTSHNSPTILCSPIGGNGFSGLKGYPRTPLRSFGECSGPADHGRYQNTQPLSGH